MTSFIKGSWGYLTGTRTPGPLTKFFFLGGVWTPSPFGCAYAIRRDTHDTCSGASPQRFFRFTQFQNTKNYLYTRALLLLRRLPCCNKHGATRTTSATRSSRRARHVVRVELCTVVTCRDATSGIWALPGVQPTWYLFGRVQEARLQLLMQLLKQREEQHNDLNMKRLDRLWLVHTGTLISCLFFSILLLR